MKLLQYFKDTKGEFRHINWPTRTQTIIFTIIVIIISFAISYYLGLFDLIFTTILEKFVF